MDVKPSSSAVTNTTTTAVHDVLLPVRTNLKTMDTTIISRSTSTFGQVSDIFF